jgi:hypothetical protein
MNWSRLAVLAGVVFLAYLVLDGFAVPAPAQVRSAASAGADSNSGGPINTSSSVDTAAGPRFDVKAAVDAYLARVPPDQRARSDAYFKGG